MGLQFEIKRRRDRLNVRNTRGARIIKIGKTAREGIAALGAAAPHWAGSRRLLRAALGEAACSRGGKAKQRARVK